MTLLALVSETEMNRINKGKRTEHINKAPATDGSDSCSDSSGGYRITERGFD
jgi:hypothetical protein